jgi:hypothetical protein
MSASGPKGSNAGLSKTWRGECESMGFSCERIIAGGFQGPVRKDSAVCEHTPPCGVVYFGRPQHSGTKTRRLKSIVGGFRKGQGGLQKTCPNRFMRGSSGKNWATCNKRNGEGPSNQRRCAGKPHSSGRTSGPERDGRTCAPRRNRRGAGGLCPRLAHRRESSRRSDRGDTRFQFECGNRCPEIVASRPQ